LNVVEGTIRLVHILDIPKITPAIWLDELPGWIREAWRGRGRRICAL
jgi:hypothetical protein